MSQAVAAGQTRSYGGLDEFFQLESAAGAAQFRMTGKIMVWKIRALCATVRLK